MFGKRVVFGILIVSLLFAMLPFNTTAQGEVAMQDGFQLLQADDWRVTIEYRGGEYSFQKVERNGKTYDQIVLKDASNLNEPGKPSLPVVSTAIGVPAEAEFSLQIDDVQTETLPGEFWIEPGTTYVIGEEELTPGEISFIEDETVYSSAENFPGVIVELGEAAKLRAQRLLPVRVYPFQFVAATKQLIRIRAVTFTIEFRYPDGYPPLAQSSEGALEEPAPFEQIYQQNLLNYSQARRYRYFEPQNELPAQLLSETSANERYKIPVTEDGIYKLTYEALQAAGMPVNAVNPQTFSMTNQGRPVSIYVHNSDGDPNKFSAGEYILFFGERLDGTYLASLYSDEDDFWRDSFYRAGESNLTSFEAKFNRYMVEKYTNQNVYWLNVGGTGGPFMEQVTALPASAPYLDAFQERIHFEQQNIWWTTHHTSVDTFFWEGIKFTSNTTKDYILNIPYPVQSGTVTLRGEFVANAQSTSVNPDHRQVFYINKTQYPNPIGTITWDGKRRYTFELSFPASYLLNGANTLTIAFEKVSGMTVDDIFVDWFEMIYLRQTYAEGDQIILNRPGNLVQEIPSDASFQIGNFSQQPVLLSIADPLSPKFVSGMSYEGGVLSFRSSVETGTSFIAAIPKTPHSVEKVIDRDYLGSRADYIFITPKVFLDSVQDFADYRQNHDGLTTKVVPLEDIFNQFNFGIYHPRAIKNYLQEAYDRWSPKPTYVLLVGDGHWNLLGSSQYDNPPIYMPPNLQWVDPWQGEIDSANDLVTVDGWDPLPDLFIGRLPVNSAAEITAYLSKVQAHEANLNQTWQKRYLFVADANDPNAGNFPALSDQVIQEYLSPGNEARKIYLDVGYTSYDTETQVDFPCGDQVGNNKCPNATQTLTTTLNTTGVGHLVYSGHGYVDGWSKAVVFSNANLDSLTNSNYLPFAFTLDCLDGYWYYPKITVSNHRGPSLIESLVRATNKGIVAAFSPTGLGVATAHDTLQRGFYDAIFSGAEWRLGSAATQAKIRIYTDAEIHVDLVHTYTVFGDPALLFSSPKVFDIFLPLLKR
ncbi:MAG: hypothetical protein ANABAC_1017 [Anaerolineae bacterium]|nr:MAG: hypothetical protein ANABAC_1017 [Anaerolineae bacterium]